MLGSALMLNGVVHTVIGVLPPELSPPFRNQLLFTNRVWEPPGLTPMQVQVGATYLQATARLKPGVTITQAIEQIAVLNKRYETEQAGRLDALNPMDVRTLTVELSGGLRQTMQLLLGAGASKDLQDEEGDTALFSAGRAAHLDAVTLLLSGRPNRSRSDVLVMRSFITHRRAQCW